MRIGLTLVDSAQASIRGGKKQIFAELAAGRTAEQMAEALVQLRAIYLSGDFDSYWQFHIEQDLGAYFTAVWSVVPK